MTHANLDLGRLLHPLTTAQFFAEYWERKPYFLERRDPEYYESLLTRHDLENLITTGDLRFPAIQLAKDGGYIPAEAYTHDQPHGTERFIGVPDLAVIAEQYRKGASIVLPALQRTWAPLAALCDALQAELDHVPHANVYITPGNATGFTPHYDLHEILVLQIAGKKRWSVYAPPIDLPHRTEVFNPKTYAPTAPIAQCQLSAGDLLYLPRGFVHSASTSQSYSAHVTIGLSVYTGVDLAKELLQACIASPHLRRGLPPGFASRTDMMPALKQRIIEALDHLRRAANDEALIDRFTQRVRGGRLKRPEPFRTDVTVIDAQSQLQAPPPDRYRVTREGSASILEYEGKRHAFPAAVETSLRVIAARRTFRPGELADDLGAEAKLGLSRYLYDIGFLKPAS